MKKFSEVEKTRKNYHLDGIKNSVHRASLFAPKINNFCTQISFLNHFKLKRGYSEVAIKLSAINCNGNLVDTFYQKIIDEKVFVFNLEDLFNFDNISSYLIEFFSSDNLFIPYPAVMVNHISDNSINTVHAYNRLLNDIFENDLINNISVEEAAIDVFSEQSNIFFNIQAGITNLDSTIYLTHQNGSNINEAKIDAIIPRLTNQNFYINDYFPHVGVGSIIKIKAPSQDMFYGRLLVGQINDKFLSGNHSYYDNSKVEEYFDNQLSYSVYPFFRDCLNKIIFYPIMSPSNIDIYIRYKSINSCEWVELKVGSINSNAKRSVEINVNNILLGNIDESNSYILICKSDNIPMRVNHQLCFGVIESPEFSIGINLSLDNDQIYVSKNAKTFTWGQIILDDRYQSYLGITNNNNISVKFTVDLYNVFGLVNSLDFELNPFSSLIKDNVELLSIFNVMNYSCRNFWYVVKSNKRSIKALSFHYNKNSSISSGEHAF